MAGFLGVLSARVNLNIGQAVAAYATLRAQNARTVYALRGTGDAFVAASKRMTIAGGGLLYVFGKAVTAAAEFERKMDFFGAVTDTNTKKMKRLSDFTLQLATDTIYSADQIAEGFIELGKAGVSATQIMHGIGRAMANLGAAGDIPLIESGQIITSTIQQFDLAASDAVKVVDLLAGAANASIADITDIGVSLKYVGGVASAAGLTFEDTATAISLLAKAGIRGSTAGTSLRQMIVSLGGATKPARQALEEIGILTEDGTNKFFDQQGKLKPLAKVYQLLNTHLDGYNQKERLAFLRTIFNNRALSAAAILTREGAKGFREMNAEMAKTTAAEVAAKRLDNLSGDIEILRGNIETLFIQAGTPFQETMRGWVQSLTKLVQAFGNLDPSTQKFIFQAIAITGAALVAAGALSFIIGKLLLVWAAALKLAAGLKFLWTIFKVVRVIMALGGLAISGTFLAIAAAVLLIVGALVLVYKKIKPFRDAVNKLGSLFVQYVVNPIVTGIGHIIDFFKKLAKEPDEVWKSIKTGLGKAAQWMGEQFAKAGQLVSDGFHTAVDAVSSFVSSVVKFILGLPGKVLGIIGDFVGTVTDLLTFRNIGFAIGFMVGLAIKWFVMLRVKLLELTINMVTGVVNFFTGLASKVGYWIGFLIGRAISLWFAFQSRILSLTGRIISGIVNFFAKLPGRIAAFVTMMASRFAAGLMNMVGWAVRTGPKVFNAIVSWIAKLPGRVWSLISNTAQRIADAIPIAVAHALSFANGIVDGIRGVLAGLPGVVWDAINAAISAFKDMVGAAFNAAKDFASGLWNGFKKGLFGSPRTKIEYAMEAMGKTVKVETDNLRKHTIQVQRLSKLMGNTDFGVGMSKTVSTLAATRNAGKVISSIGEGRAAREAIRKTGKGVGDSRKSRLIEGRLALDSSGRAFIRGVAQDVVDDDGSFDAGLKRAGMNK